MEDSAAWSDTARFYLIGIGGRGRLALQAIGAWDALEPYTAVVRGRKDWAPGAGVDEGIETIRADRPPSNVIQRDRLVACLLDQAKELNVRVRHEIDVSDISWDENGDAILQCSPCGEECAADLEGPTTSAADGSFEVRSSFVVASDGVRRTVGAALEAEDAQRRWMLPWRRFRITKFEDTSVRVYKTVPFRPPPEWRCDINYSARTSTFNFDALPSPSGRAPADAPSSGASVSDYCGVLLIKPDDEATQGLTDVAAARAYMDTQLPQFSPFIADDELQSVLDKQPSRLPVFRYAGPRLHRGASTVLLGDAVHSVKPYFGLGVNSAFEDVAVLAHELDKQPTLDKALRRFSARRAPEARVLVQLSRSFDFRGLRGFKNFIGPIILDGIFGGLPLIGKLFAPNTLAMLQKPSISFAAIRWRKRLDRTIQLALLGTTAALIASKLVAPAARAVVRLLVRTVVPALLARPALAVPSAALLVAAAVAVSRRGDDAELVPVRRSVNADVADVLSAQTSKGANDEQQPAGTRRGY